MSSYFSQGSLFGILCVLLAISCMSNGCFEEERTALLDIRVSLLGTTAGMPPSWLQSDNCCSWERVTCNNSTKRISHLYLSRLSFLSDEFAPENGCRTNLNSTAFSVFHELWFLDFSMNHVTSQIWEGLVGLTKLQHLNLSSNNCLNGTIPASLGKLVSLEVLHLEFTSMVGTLPTSGFNYTSCYEQRGFRFATKRNLYTYRRNFINWFSGMDLSANMLSGEIPWELGNLSHINALNLSYNIFTGPIPATFANMTEIESLDLSHNKLSGPIPWQLTRLSSLEVFSVAYNNLSGCIPNSGQFGSFDMSNYQGNNNLYKASQGNGCTSSPGSGPSPLEDSDEEAHDPVLYAVSAASFVLTFWATVAFMFCHSFGRRVILKL